MDYEEEGKISKWFVIPYSHESCEDDRLSCSVYLQEFALPGVPGDYQYSDYGREWMSLVKADTNKVVNETENNSDGRPWLYMKAWVKHNLHTAFIRARDTMGEDGAVLKVPRFVIRFGKILFQPKRYRGRSSYASQESFNNGSDVENYLSNFYRRYHADVPDSFVEAAINYFVPKSGLGSKETKVYYTVEVNDRYGPHRTLLCKCGVKGVGELDLQKIELKKETQLNVDISCLDKNLDLRLQLSRKSILRPVEDDERHSLKNFIKSGVVDSKEKSGLRWPLGSESLGGRYRVDGVWRTKVVTYKNSFLKLKFRCVYRFNVARSTGELTQDASLRIPELTMQLRDKSKPIPSADMLHDTLKLVWDHFLCWKGPLLEFNDLKSQITP